MIVPLTYLAIRNYSSVASIHKCVVLRDLTLVGALQWWDPFHLLCTEEVMIWI
jgi:hypothetical protein